MLDFFSTHHTPLRILLCLFCACPLHALETTPSESTSTCVVLDHPLAIAELIEIALKNNPSTKRVYWNAQRTTADVGIAESAFYPHL